MVEPTLEEILQSLCQASGGAAPEGYRSRPEWAAYWQVSENRVGKLLRAAHQAGRLLCEHRECLGIDGRRAQTPVYAFRLD